MDQKTARRIFIVICVSFVAFGSLNASLGPLLEQFSENNQVSLANIGSIYTAMFVGCLLSQLLIGRYTDRWGQLRVYSVALLCLVFGYIGMSLSHWYPLTLGFAFIGGVGFGIGVLSSNVLIGRLFEEKSVSALNLANMFFGLGDVIGPLLVSLFLLLRGNGTPSIWLAAVLTVAAALTLMIFFFNTPIGSTQAAGQGKPPERFRFTPFLISLGAIMLVYTGSEASMGGWTTTYMEGTTQISMEAAALVTSGFWLTFTLGRALGAYLGSRVKATSLLMMYFGISLAGTILFMASSGQQFWSIAAILMIGLGFGGIFPTVMGILASTPTGAPGKAATLILVMGSTGSSITPWLQGLILEKAGMRYGTLMMFILVVLMIAAFTVNRLVARKAIADPETTN
jgi:FHS family Na+ dependent glucose MFS transporter 1